jgi:periplasmic protein TonB
MLLKAHHPPGAEEVSKAHLPAPSVRLTASGGAVVRSTSDATFRYHGTPTQPKGFYAVAVLVSIALHAGLLLGFNQHKMPKRAAVVKDEPTEMLMMPDLSKDEEEEKVNELNDDEPTAPAVQVPMLQDVPLSVPVESSFTQLIDPTIPTKIEGAGSVMAIPTNIQRGRPDTTGIKDLFNIADLDRRPEPIVQTPPVFPYELKQSVSEARVRVGFIVTSKGDVIMPYIISSTHSGFERATMDAVVKWKFKPGQRGGRKVNTRVEQPIDFKVTDDQ